MLLELTSFQIFFMVLHGCLILFAILYLMRGKHSSDSIVSYRDFQEHQRRHRQQKQKPQARSTQAQAPVRDVYEAASGDFVYGHASSLLLPQTYSDEATLSGVYQYSSLPQSPRQKTITGVFREHTVTDVKENTKTDINNTSIIDLIVSREDD